MGDLKKRLKDGNLIIGTWVTINHPDIVDVLSGLPFDWLILDMEHAPLEISDIEVLMMPLKGTSISPVVRVPWNDMVAIKRALDIGAEGILVPWVNTREEAEAVVKYASYPPKGVRGTGPRKAVGYGARSFTDYYERFEKEERVIIVQAETDEALKNLEEIASTSGIDAVYVGPMDLTVNLGIPTQYDHPRFKEAMEKVVTICRKYDIAAGTHAFDTEYLKMVVDKGFRLITIMLDFEALLRQFLSIFKELGRIK